MKTFTWEIIIDKAFAFTVHSSFFKISVLDLKSTQFANSPNLRFFFLKDAFSVTILAGNRETKL